jgi:acyl-coenzyme A synthetase/AMP-(fatty) acid ligase
MTLSPDHAVKSLWESVAAAPLTALAAFHGRAARVRLAALASATILGGDLEAMRGRSVLLATKEQLATALALVELDGSARRIVLCTPDLSAEQLASVAATAAADVIVTDADSGVAAPVGLPLVTTSPVPVTAPVTRRAGVVTEWILLTSGTTGVPKLVVHDLESLAGGLPRQPAAGGGPVVWSTFYDIRRYGGLQIYLRAVLSASSLVLSCADEPVPEFFARAAAAGVTHISGTPSHWRRALMSGACPMLSPKYVRLSGEVADQTVLDNLRAAFPASGIGHAFASTEAGVAFDVNDGLAGFPADYIDSERSGVAMKVTDGTLRIRSGRTAARYLGEAAAPLASDDGFIDTGDLVELVAGRYQFRGRKTGVINVGGLKVHPEEVESVLNADARVRMSLVRGRRNPITGAVVVADVVLTDAAQVPAESEAAERVKSDLLSACRQRLPPHKVPSTLRFVPALDLTPAGKLVRSRA